MNQIVVHKKRTCTISVGLGMDVSGDTFTSEIRADKDSESTLIASWVPSFKTDGTDGELLLTLDDAVTSQIHTSHGYMDIKRISGGEPFPVFDDPLEVLFKDVVTP